MSNAEFKNRKKYRAAASRKKDYAGAVGSIYRGDQGVRLKMGNWSFPNKRILRNNLCLPACKNTEYKRTVLEI